MANTHWKSCFFLSRVIKYIVHWQYQQASHLRIITNFYFSRLNTLRCKLHAVKQIFLDEISMVGNTMFNDQINNRLKDIKGSKEAFVGVSIIAPGDLFQLEPVMAGYVFKDMKSSEYELSPPTCGRNFLQCLNWTKL